MSNLLDPASVALFAMANFLVLIAPGPAIMYTVTRSLDQGKKAGLLSVYGLALGTLPHALAVALGVAGLLESSIIAFDIMRYAGAAYLIYLGVCRFYQKTADSLNKAKESKTGMAAFWESFTVGVLNPKSVLFFLAFLPQFVDPARGHPVIQTLLLWIISQVMAVAVGSAYALAAVWFRNWFFMRKSNLAAGNYLTGSIYIFLGLAMAFASSKSK
jgi:threonine/homoserine/homoserine lactone efflux protein